MTPKHFVRPLAMTSLTLSGPAMADDLVPPKADADEIFSTYLI